MNYKRDVIEKFITQDLPKEFVTKRELKEGTGEVFVNGDSFIPNARALESGFKARMFASVEV